MSNTRNKLLGRLNLTSSAPDYPTQSRIIESQSMTVGTYYYKCPESPLYKKPEKVPETAEIVPDIVEPKAENLEPEVEKKNERKRLSASSPISLFQHSIHDDSSSDAKSAEEKIEIKNLIPEKKEFRKKNRYSQEMLFAFDSFSGEEKSKEEKNENSSEEQFQFTV